MAHYNIKNTARLRHGHARPGKQTKTYHAWLGMKNRCSNKNEPAFKYYGGRGIAVCARWAVFENFLTDMGEAPDGLSLDRWPNNDGNYEPSNCRWATNKQQSHNSSRARLFSVDGAIMSQRDLAKEFGISQPTLSRRLKRGWLLKKALETNRVVSKL